MHASSRVFYLTLALFDASVPKISLKDQRTYELYLVACSYMAIKLEHISHPSLNTIVNKLAEDNFTTEEVVKAEREIL